MRPGGSAVDVLAQGVGCNAEMRRAPDRSPVPQQDGLGRLVPDAEARRHVVGDRAMALDGYDFVNGGAVRTLDMSLQLIEGLATDTAIPTVLEQQHGPATGLFNRGFEIRGLLEVRDSAHGAATIVLPRRWYREPSLAGCLVRSCVETGSLELVARVRKEGRRLGRNRQVGPGEQPVDVIHAEPDAFHMEGLDGSGQCLALIDQGPQSLRRLGRQRLNERQNVGFGRESMIRGRRGLHSK